MSDIFISYASEDKARVEALARALEQMGWSVWWDRRIPIGRSFDEVIEEALDGAKAVVVVWTSTSVKSQWVKNEAREGLRRRVLFPVMLLEEVRLPLEFRDVQTAHLMDWQPDQEHQGFTQFIDDLVQVIGVPSSAGIQPASVIQKEEPVPPPASPTPEPEESRPVRTSETKPELQSEPDKQEPDQSVSMADVEDTDSLRESTILQGATEFSEGNREASQVNDDRSGDSTGTGQTTTSVPYLPIGIGVLAVIGALGYFLFDPGGSREMGRYEPPVQVPSSRTEEDTSSSEPEQKQPSPTLTQAKPTEKREKTGGDETVVPKPRSAAGPAKAITGKDGAPMVLIPAGNFWMGSPDGEGEEDEHPRHQVWLDAFYMDKLEVTVARYAEFMRVVGSTKPKYWEEVDKSKHGNLPVIGVDWHDATAYCKSTGKRLPTEAEWEKASRGTGERRYPWGDEQPRKKLANFENRVLGSVYAKKLDPVDSYGAGKSPYGLHHMAGNVWEWTADWYDETYYSKSPEQNPKGPSSGEYRVIRGGSWNDDPDDVRSANRDRDIPTERTANIGFRCAQDVPK